MDLLQAEIARKKKLNADIRGQAGSSTDVVRSSGSLSGIKSKYIKQADAIKLSVEVTSQAQRDLDEQRALKRARASNFPNIEPKSSGNAEQQLSSSSPSSGILASISVSQLQGGDCNRSDDDNNSRNNQYSSSSHSDNSKNSNSGTSIIASSSSIEEKKIVEKNREDKVDKEDKEDKEEVLDLNIKYSQIPGYTTEKVIYKYFKTIVKIWAADLEMREDKNTMAYKRDLDAHKQIKDNVKPLFTLCKEKGLDASLLDHLGQMVVHCEKDDFRGAHDWYLRAAIGNAAWPMGITMAGIHERSGREKISTSKVAHVMNSEQHRKFLTAVKRLMTYAQSKRPDLAPSMMMLN